MKKLVFVICFLFIILLSGCGDTYTYSDYQKYNKGGSEITEKIDNINIDWISGNVKFDFHKENNIKFYEESSLEISEDREMRYYYNDNELYIKFAKSGIKTWSLNKKDLIVLLPYETKLKDVNINNVSSDININAILCEKMYINNVSGNIEMSCSKINESSIQTVSGNVDITASMSVNSIKAESVSGEINVTVDKIDTLILESVSGKINVKGNEINSLNLGSASGSIKCQVLNIYKSILKSVSGKIVIECSDDDVEFNVETVSGDVNIFSTVQLNCILEIETTSGSFSSDFNYKNIEKDIYEYGTGKINNKIKTVSGSIKIRKLI